MGLSEWTNDLRDPDFISEPVWSMLGEGSRIDVDDAAFAGLPSWMQLRLACAASRLVTGGLCSGVRTFVNLTGQHLDDIINFNNDFELDRELDRRPKCGVQIHPLQLLGVKSLSSRIDEHLPHSIKTMKFDRGFSDSIRGYKQWPPSLEVLVFSSISRNDSILDENYVFPTTLERVYFPENLPTAPGEPYFSLATSQGFTWPNGILHMSLRVDYRGIQTSLNNAERWPPRLESLRLRITSVRSDRLTETCVSEYLETLPDTLNTLHLEIDQRTDNMLRIVWPVNLKKLTLEGGSKMFNPTSWPTTLTDLYLERFYSTQLLPRTQAHENLGQLNMATVVWPPNLERLTLPLRMEVALVDCVWPSSLKHLALPVYFGEWPGTPNTVPELPHGLLSIKFPYMHNQPLLGAGLRDGIERVHFGSRYNQPFPRPLPASLKHLVFEMKFGCAFDHPLPSVALPQNLITLCFGASYDQPLPNFQLPPNLLHLRFGGRYNHRLPNHILPAKLQSLEFGYRYSYPLPEYRLPRTLKIIIFGNNYNDDLPDFELPEELQTLTFGHSFNRTLPDFQLPSKLLHLTFGRQYNRSLPNHPLPPNLERLIFGNSFDQTLPNYPLPKNLESLTFGNSFDQTLPNYPLPENLESLTFGNSYNRTLPNSRLPVLLETLTFGRDYDKPLPGFRLSASLQTLEFGQDYNTRLPNYPLPRLRKLKFGRSFNKPLPEFPLPVSLETLTLPATYDKNLPEMAAGTSVVRV